MPVSASSEGPAWLWLHLVLDARHRVAIKHRSRDDQPWTWCVPVSRYEELGVLAWPAEYKELVAYPGVGYLELSTDVAQVLFVPAFFLSERTIMAGAYVWKSPLQQALEYPASGGELGAAFRPLISGEITSLQRLAAFHAFWTLPLSVCVELANHWKIELDAATTGSLFDTMFTMIKASLDDAPDEQVFVILRQRLAANEEASQSSEEIPLIDESMALYDKLPFKEVVFFNSKKAAAMTVSAGQTFTDTFRKRFREKVNAAKSFGAQARALKYSKPSLQVPDSCNISQDEATVLLPCGATVWEDYQKKIWFAHMPPFPRAHASWTTYGSEGAALSAVLKVVWKQYSDLHDLPIEACRVEGLFSSSSS